MVASRRERIIGLITAGVLVVLALDRLVLSPLTERGAALAERVTAAQAEVNTAKQLFENQPRMYRRWSDMRTAGIKADAVESESQALDAIREWAEESAVTLTSLKPERTETKPHFQVVILRATCTGTMRSISELLWRVQTASIPIRVTDMQISARKPGTDDLTLQLGVSTISLAPPADPAKAPAGGRGARPAGKVAAAGGAATLANRGVVR